jgi:hypothetical protein
VFGVTHAVQSAIVNVDLCIGYWADAAPMDLAGFGIEQGSLKSCLAR